MNSNELAMDSAFIAELPLELALVEICGEK